MVRKVFPGDPLRAPVSQRGRQMDVGEREGVGAKIAIDIDGLTCQVPLGVTLLSAAKEVGIRIPTLCHHPDLCIAGVCRICLVEIEGQRTLQAACAYPVVAPVKVHTNTPKVRRARRHVLDLLLSSHQGECYACNRNGRCELQTLAKEYGVDGFRFGRKQGPPPVVDRSSNALTRDMGKCILCRRCVRSCIDLQEVGTLEVAGRGASTRVVTYGDRPLGEVVCIQCGQCMVRCPTGALQANDATDDVWAAIDDSEKHVVIQTAPSPRAAIGECFGKPPGVRMTFELNTALRRCGFDRVFDTNFAADLTIIEEGTELLIRLQKTFSGTAPEGTLPLFTSCSPGWVKFLEHFYPEFLPHLSSAKSPQQMFGALIKSYYAKASGIDPARIVSVALMPCSAKKFEANRPEMTASGFKDVDFGLTTRELAKMISESGIDLPSCPGSDFDGPFGTATGSGVIFGATGGVMEAAIRTVFELVTGQSIERLFQHGNVEPVRGFEGIRTAEIPIKDVGLIPPLLGKRFTDWEWLKGKTLKVAVCHGTANARKVLEDLRHGGRFRDFHFIEFMACPGGCLGGGGQPIPNLPETRAARAGGIYAEDCSYRVRKSHENPAVLKLYEEFLEEGPGGRVSHQFLHTNYTPRGKFIG